MIAGQPGKHGGGIGRGGLGKRLDGNAAQAGQRVRDARQLIRRVDVYKRQAYWRGN